MPDLWLKLTDLPAEGAVFEIDDRQLWERAWKRFGVEAAHGEKPLASELRVIPADKGYLVRGRIEGDVVLPCDRCAKDFRFEVKTDFEQYESFEPQEDDGEPLLKGEPGDAELNAGSLLWQQFAVALPAKAVCDRACRGLCAKCGRDLNLESCDCGDKDLDPRMAALRNLKVNG